MVSQDAGGTSSGRHNPFAGPVVKQPEPFNCSLLDRNCLGEAQVSASDLKIARSARDQPEGQTQRGWRLIAGGERWAVGRERRAAQRNHQSHEQRQRPPAPAHD
jgi:hypothetical protein